MEEKIIRQAGEFLTKAKSAYEAAGYEVQTTRLATIPFPKMLGEKRIDSLPKFAEQLERCDSTGKHRDSHFAWDRLCQTSEVFEAMKSIPKRLPHPIILPSAAGWQINAVGLRSGCHSRLVRGDHSKKFDDPKQRFCQLLRFAALANVKAGTPFFPAAYHDGDKPAFAIATEAADLAVSAFGGQKTVDGGRSELISEITKHGKAIARAADDLSQFPIPNSQFPKFLGIDFSLAPFPAEAQSLGTAFERMGVPQIGLHGSLAAAAILTECIERADFPHTGFSGLMMPVLEDATLAQHAAEGTLSVKDVLLYSAVLILRAFTRSPKGHSWCLTRRPDG